MRCLLLLGPVLGLSMPALAQYDDAQCRKNPHLSRAKDEYERLEFDRAARTLQRAVEFTRNCRWDLAEIYRLKGFVDAVNNERERCQRSFEILLALDPDYVMAKDVPPKIRSCFEEALEVPQLQRRLDMEHGGIDTVLPDAPLSIDVRLDDPLRLVNEVQVFFEERGSTSSPPSRRELTTGSRSFFRPWPSPAATTPTRSNISSAPWTAGRARSPSWVRPESPFA